jgi:hypothetical protein
MAFDSCQMGNFETLMTLSPVAKYVIASEYPITYKENVLKQNDAYGLPIESLIRNLSQFPDMSVSETAKLVINRFDQVYKDFGFYHSRSGKTYYPESSLALFDLSYASRIKQYVKTITGDLMNQADRHPELFEAIFTQLLKMHAVCHPVGYLDLAHFAEIVYRISGIESAQALLSEVNLKDRFIRDKSIRHTASEHSPSGVSIFFPGSITAGQDNMLKELHSIYAKFKISKETGLSNLINAYLKFVERKRAKILTNIVKEHINYGKKFLFEPSEGKYDELYLFTVTEISLYPLLKNGDYDSVKQYIEMIMGSSYQSRYFEKHKKDIRGHLQRLWRNENEMGRKNKLKKLIRLFTIAKTHKDL